MHGGGAIFLEIPPGNEQPWHGLPRACSPAPVSLYLFLFYLYRRAVTYKILLCNIIFETHVLVIYFCFEICVFIDRHCKLLTELTEMIQNRQKWMLFRQGGLLAAVVMPTDNINLPLPTLSILDIGGLIFLFLNKTFIYLI